MITIAPAILARDAGSFIQRIQSLREHVSIVQLDVINNTLVSGEAVADPALIKSLKTALTFEVHLMVDVKSYDLTQWNHSWVQSIIVHCESEAYRDALATIRSWGKLAFLAINPSTQVEILEGALDACDGVVFMTVQPGAMGNEFHHEVVERIARFHEAHPSCVIEVDGGVNSANIKHLVNAGATRFAVGSFIDSAHVEDRLAQLTRALGQ